MRKKKCNDRISYLVLFFSPSLSGRFTHYFHLMEEKIHICLFLIHLTLSCVCVFLFNNKTAMTRGEQKKHAFSIKRCDSPYFALVDVYIIQSHIDYSLFGMKIDKYSSFSIPGTFELVDLYCYGCTIL